MNVNSETHFSQVPDTIVGHSVFDRPFDWAGTCNAGVLNAFYLDESIPGDIYQITPSQLTRMTTPIFPVMGTIAFDMFYFFVPWRLVWSHTKNFFGENTSTYWTPTTVYTMPYISTMNLGTRAPGDLAHQLGIPLNPGTHNISSLPFRSVRLIWNEFFRATQVEPPYLLNTGDGPDTDSSLNSLYPVSRIHDWAGSVLPSPQYSFGADVDSNGTVKIGLEGQMPVVTLATVWTSANLNANPLKFATTSSAGATAAAAGNLGIGASGNAVDTTGTNTNTNGVLPSNLAASADKAAASLGIDVNTLRMSVQMQKTFEAMSRFGSRYVEVLRGIFGIVSDDARLQRPELIGAERWYLNMSDNYQTSASSSTGTPLSTVSGISKTSGIGGKIRYSVREHGYVIGLFCLRIATRYYTQGIEPLWFRSGLFSVYNPKLAHIGEQPVYTRSIYANGNTIQPGATGNIFGYQEAWWEYRMSKNRLSGLLDPGSDLSTSVPPAPQGLGAYWTYGDWYNASPTLSPSWLHEGSENVERTLAVTNEDQFIVNIHVDNKHVRPMPVYSVPGFVDHF